jgi:hypothetical protein
VVSACTVGISIARVVPIVLYSGKFVNGEEFQRSSAQGYIIDRDIVSVGVCDDGDGRWWCVL